MPKATRVSVKTHALWYSLHFTYHLLSICTWNFLISGCKNPLVIEHLKLMLKNNVEGNKVHINFAIVVVKFMLNLI